MVGFGASWGTLLMSGKVGLPVSAVWVPSVPEGALGVAFGVPLEVAEPMDSPSPGAGAVALPWLAVCAGLASGAGTLLSSNQLQPATTKSAANGSARLAWRRSTRSRSALPWLRTDSPLDLRASSIDLKLPCSAERLLNRAAAESL